MRAIDRTRVGTLLDRTSVTRLAELPPPSPASMRAAARRRGAFAESLPTLRLPRVALAEVAHAGCIEDAVTLEVTLESDGVPVAIGARMTMELGSGDVVIDDGATADGASSDGESSDGAFADGASEDDSDDDVPEVEPDAEVAEDPHVLDPDAWADELDPKPTPVPWEAASGEACTVAPSIAVCEHAADIVVVGNTVRAIVPLPVMPVMPIQTPVPTPTRRSSALLIVAVAAIAGALGWRGALVTQSAPQRATTALAGFAALPDRTATIAPDRSLQPAPIAVLPPVPIAVLPPAELPAMPMATQAVGQPVSVSAVAPAPPVVEAAVVNPPAVANPQAASKPAAKPSPSRRRRVVEEEVDELPVAAAPVVAVSPKVAPDNDMLMREALRAFSQSRWATAFHYTERARALGPNTAASRLAAISACHLGRAAKAEVAYRELPLGQRTGVRNTCRAAGVMLPEPPG